MAKKISITIDVAKIDKTKIQDREYSLKDGTKKIAKNYKCDLVELTDKKLIKTGDGWALYKTHFLAEAQTKEERESGSKAAYIGEGFQFLPHGGQEMDSNPDGDFPF